MLKKTFLLLLAAAMSASFAEFSRAQNPPPEMKLIPGGDFTLGSDDPTAMINERPATKTHVDAFFIDEHDVTNAEFHKFVMATGYVTTAERPVDWEVLKKQLPAGTPKPDAAALAPGALVFVSPDHPAPLDDLSAWWQWTPGVSWKHPGGPHTDLTDKDDVPVVQVSWDDATAYAAWAHKRLPTEKEWEYAAWGGKSGTRYYWGNEFKPAGKFMCNTFTGTFPMKDTAEDLYAGPSPVHAFPPNALGLYDMAGNVWQWTADTYTDRHDSMKDSTSICCPTTPTPALLPFPNAMHPIERVVKGGSFLCSASYCESYRPSARRGVTPDTATQHTGFRCALSLSDLSPSKETKP